MTTTSTNLDMAITEKMIATPYNNFKSLELPQLSLGCWTTPTPLNSKISKPNEINLTGQLTQTKRWT